MSWRTGKSIESIDAEKIKAELGMFSDLFEGCGERYGLDRPGIREDSTVSEYYLY